MRFIKKIFLPVYVIIVCTQNIANGYETSNQTELKNIEAVIEAFSASIIHKNKPVFTHLFYNKTVPWLGVASDQTLALSPPVKVGESERTKVRGGDYLSFIDWIVSTPKAIEEKFWDVKILHDNDIASVHFKYSFHQDDAKTNWGEEAWQLVRTEQGWKIASVIYSITIKSK